MRLTLHHIEITLKYDQNKAVASFEFAQRFFLLYEVCHPQAEREGEREKENNTPPFCRNVDSVSNRVQSMLVQEAVRTVSTRGP